MSKRNLSNKYVASAFLLGLVEGLFLWISYEWVPALYVSTANVPNYRLYVLSMLFTVLVFSIPIVAFSIFFFVERRGVSSQYHSTMFVSMLGLTILGAVLGVYLGLFLGVLFDAPSVLSFADPLILIVFMLPVLILLTYMPSIAGIGMSHMIAKKHP